MENETYVLIKSAVKKNLNIDLNYYKDEQMKRRLDSWLVRTRQPSWPEYLKVCQQSPEELSKLRDYLTINVTEFFRDPDRWDLLRKNVMPELIKEATLPGEPKRGLRVWSAGCSIGVEAYTLAILLDEVTPTFNNYLLATDFDRGALAKAKARGPYNADEIRNLTPQQRSRHLDIAQGNFIKETTAKKVTFREQNLLEDKFENNFDLIVCRNVVIYFTNEAKSQLYAKFRAALRPGGVLFLGGTEIIPRPQELGMRNYGISFYINQ
jgi:chemotaxis protein methyltransferase CheR